MLQMRLQKTGTRKSPTESKRTHKQHQEISDRDKQRRPKNEHITHPQSRMPQMRKQFSLRLASANARRRRIINPVHAMHKMRPHLPRIHITQQKDHGNRDLNA